MKLLQHVSLVIVACLVAACGRTPNPGPPPAAAQPNSTATPKEVASAPPAFLPQVREGFEVSKWADVPNARSLAVSPDGKTVFVGSRKDFVSKVSITDSGPKVEAFQTNLVGANGVCFVDEDLLIAERLVVKRYSANDGFKPGAKGEVVLDGFPDETHHGWRYVKVGPDDRVYVAIGAPCNVCERKDDPRLASICSFTTEGKDFRIDAKGVRNSVGFDWHPGTGHLYFTDNGRDMLGDDIPPCELNILERGKVGEHFGFPYRYGNNVKDPKFGDKAPDREFVVPHTNFQAHVAPLGCYFPKTALNKKHLSGQVLVAQHGSWNRSSKVGYRVVSVKADEAGSPVEPFLWGFMNAQTDQVWGRPVDVAELPDGTILVSDDYANVIWAVKAK